MHYLRKNILMNNNIFIIKRLYKDYTAKHLKKIILAIFFSIIVAASTSGKSLLNSSRRVFCFRQCLSVILFQAQLGIGDLVAV